jgi:hypothetical protein
MEKRTFPAAGLGGAEGRLVLKVGGTALYAVDVERDRATLTTATAGPARVAATFDSKETLDAILDGRLHPIVAGLQSRYTQLEGDRRFGLSVLLALRAASPTFARTQA